jgi:hypothetical protein
MTTMAKLGNVLNKWAKKIVKDAESNFGEYDFLEGFTLQISNDLFEEMVAEIKKAENYEAKVLIHLEEDEEENDVIYDLIEEKISMIEEKRNK